MQTDAAETKLSLWVVEATIDLPIAFSAAFQTDGTKSVVGMLISLGGDDADGCVQLRPLETDPNKSGWWDEDRPVVFECRALVRAPDSFFALLRGKYFYEHLSDRLTLITGYPVRALEVGATYNEDMLRRCITGELNEYDATTGGRRSFRIQPPKNLSHYRQFLIPQIFALDSIRWFRRAMTSSNQLDQFLFYFFAIESLAPHIPSIVRRSRQDKPEELESELAAALRLLASRYPELPERTGTELRSIRGPIAHGGSDMKSLDLAIGNLPLIQRLAADGIAMVSGVDPAQFVIMQPPPFRDLAPVMSATYSADDNPLIRWGKSLLSDEFSRLLSAQSERPPGPA